MIQQELADNKGPVLDRQLQNFLFLSYVLPVKGNQGNLDVAIDDHLEDDFALVKVSRFETDECRHVSLGGKNV
jgi:hypothetical protein